jgi:hypothetical protein
MWTLLCPIEYLSACRRINFWKLMATSEKRSAVITILFVIVVSSVIIGGMGVLGLINSENIASSTGIPLGSKICAASL